MKSKWSLLIFVVLFAFGCGSNDDDDATDFIDDDMDDDVIIDDDAISDDDQADDDETDDDTVDDDALDDDTVDDDTVDDDSVDDDAVDDDVVDDDAVDDDAVDDDATDDDTAPPECEDYQLPQIDGHLGTEDLTETSGLAISLKNPGVMWAHNDSGDGPYLYAITLDGSYLGRLTLDGATAIDWEDMAAGPCGDDECLYIGDHGDNGSSRTDCAVYRVVEPEVDPLVPFDEMLLDTWEYFPFSYPDGPRDAEALAVHPDGSVYIFSKYPYGTSEVYVFPELTPDTPVTLTYLGDLDTGGGIAMTTAASIHRNGLRLLLRTYLTVLEWRLDPGDPFENMIDADSQLVPAGIEIQGEAICYDPATGGYHHTQEGSEPPIYRIDCQE